MEEKSKITVIGQEYSQNDPGLKRQCFELALKTVKTTTAQDPSLGNGYQTWSSARSLTTEEAIESAKKIYDFITSKN